MTYKHYLIIFFTLLTFWGAGKIAQSETNAISSFSGSFVSSWTQSSGAEVSLHGAIGDTNSRQMKSESGNIVLLSKNLIFDLPRTSTSHAFIPSIYSDYLTPCFQTDLEPSNDSSTTVQKNVSICAVGQVIQGEIEEGASDSVPDKPEADIYWLKIYSQERVKIIQQNTSGQSSTNFTLALFDDPEKPAKENIASNIDQKEINRVLDAGEYFIVITSVKGNGSYTLTVQKEN